MKKGNKSVFAIFKSKPQIESAIERLKDAGYRTSDISVLMPEYSSSDDFAHVKQSKVPEGAATGAGTGLVLGGALGWLVGAGVITLTGLGPLVAAGPLIASLAGAGVGGTVGGLAGSLVGMGIPEFEAKRYESSIKEGGILLSVHADDQEWADKACDILEDLGGQDVSIAKEEEGGGDLRQTKAG